MERSGDAEKILEFILSPDESNRNLGLQLLNSQESVLSGREFYELQTIYNKIKHCFICEVIKENSFRLEGTFKRSFDENYSITEYVQDFFPSIEEIFFYSVEVDAQSIRNLALPKKVFTGLKSFTISSNKIKLGVFEINLSKMPVLERLDISYDGIVELNLISPNDCLKYLRVDGNSLGKNSIALISNLNSLEELTVDIQCAKDFDLELVKNNWRGLRRLTFNCGYDESEKEHVKIKNKFQKILPNTYIKI